MGRPPVKQKVGEARWSNKRRQWKKLPRPALEDEHTEKTTIAWPMGVLS